MTNNGKMLGKTWEPFTMPGRKPCGCPDCDQIGFGGTKGNTKRMGRRMLRAAEKRNLPKVIREYD